MKCAIVGLVRGYDSWYRYKQLIERNDRIHRYFNYKYNYPIIIFHEGNIKKKHQHKLKSLTPNISFVEVTNFHDLPYVKHNIFLDLGMSSNKSSVILSGSDKDIFNNIINQ